MLARVWRQGGGRGLGKRADGGRWTLRWRELAWRGGWRLRRPQRHRPPRRNGRWRWRWGWHRRNGSIPRRRRCRGGMRRCGDSTLRCRVPGDTWWWGSSGRRLGWSKCPATRRRLGRPGRFRHRSTSWMALAGRRRWDEGRGRFRRRDTTRLSASGRHVAAAWRTRELPWWQVANREWSGHQDLLVGRRPGVAGGGPSCGSGNQRGPFFDGDALASVRVVHLCPSGGLKGFKILLDPLGAM